MRLQRALTSVALTHVLQDLTSVCVCVSVRIHVCTSACMCVCVSTNRVCCQSCVSLRTCERGWRSLPLTRRSEWDVSEVKGFVTTIHAVHIRPSCSPVLYTQDGCCFEACLGLGTQAVTSAARSAFKSQFTSVAGGCLYECCTHSEHCTMGCALCLSCVYAMCRGLSLQMRAVRDARQDLEALAKRFSSRGAAHICNKLTKVEYTESCLTDLQGL